MRSVVRAARIEDQVTLSRIAREHLGPGAEAADVLQETWPGYEHVNVQAGLDDWLSAPGREHRLVGVVGARHQEFGLADLLQPEGPGYLPHPGGVSRLRLPSGPAGETRAVVQCGLYLLSEGDRHTLLLLRGPASEIGRESTTVQVASGDAEADAAVARELRRLANVHNVFRGQVLSFGGEVFGHGGGLLQFHERPAMTADQASHVVIAVHLGWGTCVWLDICAGRMLTSTQAMSAPCVRLPRASSSCAAPTSRS